MEVTLQPRIIRAGQAPAYCGMGRDIFAKEIRPFEMVKVVSRDSNPHTPLDSNGQSSNCSGLSYRADWIGQRG